MAIKLELVDEEQIKEIVTAAILTHLGPEKRDELIQNTLKMLLETKERKDPNKTYGTIMYSPLQEAFEKGAIQAANEICKQYFDEGKPARLEVERVIDEAIEKWLAESKDDMIKNIATELSSVVRRHMWNRY